MVRLNPAGDDYQIRRLLDMVEALRAELRSAQAYSHSEAGPVDGSTESIVLDPSNPQIYIYTSPLVDPLAQSFDIPVSTLMVPDPAIVGAMLFPTLVGA